MVNTMRKELPSAIMKKYGVTKKAWAVFRATKTHKYRQSPNTSMAKKKHTSHKKSSFLNGASTWGPIAGGAGYELLKPQIQGFANGILGDKAGPFVEPISLYVLGEGVKKFAPTGYKSTGSTLQTVAKCETGQIIGSMFRGGGSGVGTYV